MKTYRERLEIHIQSPYRDDWKTIALPRNTEVKDAVEAAKRMADGCDWWIGDPEAEETIATAHPGDVIR